eukprot:CAMPEP_0170953614 /NCGR_PEP_ID=MMETSP0735-20130129/32022_1 /TAXON_ID=186038 /ORGANISM="Fragilariopsis kerguelensis, Strain L26-C5" /LENGTH=49 /DNA_ID=CAMNT_0011364995 /DNA_START=200 /DNA_END=349 /DNA_ORIENTATION=+
MAAPTGISKGLTYCGCGCGCCCCSDDDDDDEDSDVDPTRVLAGAGLSDN